jgi:hypothetical protein
MFKGTDLITVKTLRMKQLFVLLLFASLCGYSQDYAKQFAIPANQTLSSADDEEGPYEVVIKKNNSYEPGFLNNIPGEVMREFSKTYPAAKNVSWFIDDKTTTVYFDSDNQVCIVKFKNDGLQLMIKKSYGGKALNTRLADFLKPEIKGYEIKYISEVIRETTHNYEINLARNGTWLILKIGEDEKGQFQVLGRKAFDKN